MLQDADIVAALKTVAARGFSEEAKICAQGALQALFPPEPASASASAGKGGVGGRFAAVGLHVMLSYQWKHQATIKRINQSLQQRGYLTWFDLEKMQGSVMDAMVSERAVPIISNFFLSDTYGIDKCGISYKVGCACTIYRRTRLQLVGGCRGRGRCLYGCLRVM